MKLKAKNYDVDSSEHRVIMNDLDCLELGIKEMDRVRLTHKRASLTAIVGISDTVVNKGDIILYGKTFEALGVKENGEVGIAYASKPESVRFIRRKMDGETLAKEEIDEIVEDILENRLTPIEISAWLTSLYINGMDLDEVANFAMSMVRTGDVLEFDRSPVFDFHSVGGVPGNKITPIVVSIVASAGLLIPKTSSRAISSAAGTSDIVEVFCKVDLDSDKLRSVAEEVGGVFAWGGSINLAPVDDMVIKVEYPLGINPRAQMLASIMSKKKAIGADYLLVDIPTGRGTKVETIEEARKYARDFMDLGNRMGMHVECAITYGDQPVGSAIGPALEARECIRVLEGDPHPSSVVEKACDIAGMILEMGGVPSGGQKAREILASGQALKKFREIVEAQEGKADLKSTDIEIGKHVHSIESARGGYVHDISNKELVAIARAAGSPNDKGAGLLIFKKKGQRVEVGDPLFEIYADNEAKLRRAMDLAMKLQPINIEGMLIKKVPEVARL